MKIYANIRAVALLFAIIPMLLVSCSQKAEEPKELEVEETHPQGTLRSMDIATLISSGDFSISDFESLALSIQSNAEIGNDEKVYLSDLSTLRASENSFASKLLQKLNSSSLRSSSDNDFSLYWRSCKKWDGKERPVIAYVSEETSDNATTIPALQFDESGKGVNTIMIDEEYAKTHPTLIVNTDEKPFGKLIPIRPEGYVSNLVVPSIDYNPILPRMKKVKSLYLGDLQVTKHFDIWFKGGSEICFVAAYPRAIIDENGQVKFEERLTYQRRDVTRDQIDNQEVLHLDYDLVLDWDPNLDCIGWLAYEKDSVLSPGGEFKFTFFYKGFKCEVNATVPKTKEKIVRIDYTGNYLMSTDNINPDTKQWIMHNANGISYTLPVKIATILPDHIFEGAQDVIYNP